MYAIHIQKTRTGKYRVCLVRDDNGKLVLQGEPINRRQDANWIQDTILGHWNGGIMSNLRLGKDLPASHRFPKNAGPKKKAVKSTSKRK